MISILRRQNQDEYSGDVAGDGDGDHQMVRMNIFQERAFWDVYRPPPGQLSTTELDIKKMLVNLNECVNICIIKDIPGCLSSSRIISPFWYAQLMTTGTDWTMSLGCAKIPPRCPEKRSLPAGIDLTQGAFLPGSIVLAGWQYQY